MNIVEFFLQEPRETLIESKGKHDWTPLHYSAYENQSDKDYRFTEQMKIKNIELKPSESETVSL